MPSSTPTRPTARKAAAKAKPAVRPAAKPATRPAGAPVVAKKSATKKAPAAKPASGEAAKPRIKLVRDSFTMPQEDFDLVAAMKKRALGFRRPAKKSELLRAGLHALHALDNVALKAALERLSPVKAGRPKKHA